MHILQPVKLLEFVQILLWAFAVSTSAAGSNATISTNALSNNVPLRILPLGNSITFGFQSTDGNGYRKRLLDKITASGTTAQYIGSVRAGNMTDNRNEGHPGAIITEIGSFSRVSLVQRPNLILLMAGTNDMNNNLLAGATDRLGNLIDMCSAACPDAVILVAQLTPNANASIEARVEQFNPSVPGLVAIREQNGRKIAVVNMTRFITTADLRDGLHPNDAGYAKMAGAWFEGIQQASLKGWLTPPVDITRPSQSVGVTSVIPTFRTLAPILSSSTSRFIATTVSSTLPIFTSSIISSFPTIPTIPTVPTVPTNRTMATSSSVSSTSSFLVAVTVPTILSVPLATPASTSDASFAALAVPTAAVVPVASLTPTNDARLALDRIFLGHHHPISMLALAGIWLSLLGL